MSTKGIGWAGVCGLLGLAIVTVIAAIYFTKSMDQGVEAKQHAERTVDEVRETIRLQEQTRESILQSTQRDDSKTGGIRR